jgi:t-SNARE complex subunit (syntaxin)
MYQFKELFQSKPIQSDPEVHMDRDKKVQLEPKQIQNDSFEKAIAQERAQAIKELLQESREVNQLVKTTATLVDEQDEMVDTIRNNITNARENIQDGSLDVRIAEASKSSCRLF